MHRGILAALALAALATDEVAHPACIHPHPVVSRAAHTRPVKRREWHERMDPEREGRFAFQFHGLQQQEHQFLGLWYRQGLKEFWIPAALALDLLKATLRQTWIHARLAHSFEDPAPGVPLGQAPLAELEQVRKPLAPYSPARREALRQQRKRRKG